MQLITYVQLHVQEGLIAQWNSKNPSKQIQLGDLVLEASRPPPFCSDLPRRTLLRRLCALLPRVLAFCTHMRMKRIGRIMRWPLFKIASI